MKRLRLAVFLIALAFSITLAIVVGQRLSDQALSVVVGVVAGVAASIPTSLIVVWLTARPTHPSMPAPARPAAQDFERDAPRVIVVQPPAPPPASTPLYDPRYAPPSPGVSQGRRAFTIIGGDEAE